MTADDRTAPGAAAMADLCGRPAPSVEGATHVGRTRSVVFAWKPGEAGMVPCPPDEARAFWEEFRELFDGLHVAVTADTGQTEAPPAPRCGCGDDLTDAWPACPLCGKCAMGCCTCSPEARGMR